MLSDIELENLLNLKKEEIKKGLSEEQLLNDLSKENISVIDVIRIDKELFHNSLVEAKNVVQKHPSWKEKHEKYEQFHDELKNSLDNEFNKE